MNISIIFLIAILFLGTFFLVPKRTALKTAMRYKIHSNEVISKFSMFHSRRIAIAVFGFAASICFGVLDKVYWLYATSMLSLVVMYFLDFFSIERIAKEIDAKR